jgi:hypothetical protein
MTTQIASAALTSTATLKAITGFINYRQGNLDSDNVVRAITGGNRWGDVATWANFKSYQNNYLDIIWTAPVVDIGAIDYFTLNIETDVDGELFFKIYISDTGLFAGEETEYIITNGNYNVESFYGRYAYVTAFVVGRELRKLQITTNTNKITYDINNVTTSTLSGSSSERTITLPRAVSKITDIFISPKAPTAYAVNLYVSDTATSQVLIPIVKNKSNTAPTFALYGIDNDARDGVVDIKITALPRMVMYGGRLTVVE